MISTKAVAALRLDSENADAKSYLEAAGQSELPSALAPILSAPSNAQPTSFAKRPLHGDALPGRRREEEGLPSA